jgi:hypothetical protein
MNRTFYRDLPALRDFERFTEDLHYQALPPEWVVYVTDVVNSTQAIAEGTYKEVNLIGATSITLCINLLGELRVARIPIATIEAAGRKVEVAKYEREAGNAVSRALYGVLECGDAGAPLLS